MHWDANTIIPLITVLIYAALVVIVARAKPSTQEHVSFLLYLLAMTFWSLGSFFMHAAIWEPAFWFRVFSAAGLGSFLAVFHFVQVSLNRKYKWAVGAYLFGGLSLIISLIPEMMVQNVIVENGEVVFDIGFMAPIIAPPMYAMYFLSLFQLIRAYRSSKDILQQNRLRYLSIGLGVIIFATFINFTPLGRYPIDIAANGFSAILLAYAIIRHELLDITMVIRQSLSYATLIIVLGLSYLLPILVFDQIAAQLSIGRTMPGFFLALGFSLLFASIIHSIYGQLRNRIDQFFFRERHDAYAIIQELGEQITGSLDLDQVVSAMLNRLVETLHPKNVLLMLQDPTSQEFCPTASRGLENSITDFRMRADHPICRWLKREERVLTIQQIDIHPQFSSMWEEERSQLYKSSPDLFVALRAKRELSGILLIGPKQSEKPYTLEEIGIFSTFTNQVAVALENARLFKETNTRLSEQIALLEIGNNLARASELDDILQLVVKHACPTDTPTAKATIHLIDHETKRLLPRAVSQSSGEPAQAVGFDPHQGIAGRAVQEKQLIYVPDVNKAPDFVNTQENFKSLVVVPLIIEDVPEGTLSVTSPHVDAFDEDLIRQLTSLGNQAAIALRKAQITDSLRKSNIELEQRSKELEASIEELKSTQRQLIQASKLASMGTLTAGIAHEINNPLAGIKLFAQNTIRAHNEGRLETEKMLENLDKISALVDKAAKIIEHLRTFSRQASGDMELIGVNNAVEDSLSMLFEQLKLQNIEVLLQLEENLPRVRGDINQIEQVVLNLITNARDSLDKVEDKKISLRTYQDDELVVIEVTDSGSGISPEILESVFDPFFTTKPVDKGTGLGLSISHGIVELHSGEIEVESRLDKGSTFRIKLPAVEDLIGND